MFNALFLRLYKEFIIMKLKYLNLSVNMKY
jgi:hypothetical protein